MQSSNPMIRHQKTFLAHVMRASAHPSTRMGHRSARMTLDWILLSLVFWAIGLLAVFALFRMAGDQDRAARYQEKRLDPGSDVTITQFGNG